MRSYASSGRVITVTNSGPGAVEVRADQPYRLRGLTGVTQYAAEVDDDLNLCVEGVYELVVALADGVTSAEAGDPVLMADDGTFALVAGLADATGHVLFGVLAERVTRRRLALVKLATAQATAAATGGATDGGSGAGSAGGALVLSGLSLGPDYTATGTQYLYATNTIDGVGVRPMFIMSPSPDFVFPCARYPGGAPTKDYIGVVERGIYVAEAQISFTSNVDDFGVLINAYVYDANGTFIDSLANLTVRNGAIAQQGGTVTAHSSNDAFYARVGKNNGFVGLRAERTFALDAGWKIALQIDGDGPNGTNDGSYITILNPSDPTDGDPNGWYAGARTSITLRRIA